MLAGLGGNGWLLSSFAFLPGTLVGNPLKRLSVRIIALFTVLIALTACSHEPQRKGPAKHYGMTGRVTALDAKNQTATVDAAAIPNFMEAMTMAYPVESKADFSKLRVGEFVKATVNVYDSGDYNLSDIQEQPSAKQ